MVILEQNFDKACDNLKSNKVIKKSCKKERYIGMIDRNLYKEGKIILRWDTIKGYCVMAGQNLDPDEFIAVNPISFIGFEDLIDESQFKKYPMYWNKKVDCISFGIINLLNHSKKSNVRLKRDYKFKLIRAYAIKSILSGTELTIDYDCPLWFDEL